VEKKEGQVRDLKKRSTQSVAENYPMAAPSASAHHVIEKLTSAIEILSTHPDDVRKRIEASYLVFAHLQPQEFPKELQNDFRWILREINRFEPFIDPFGSFSRSRAQETMRRVRKSTGVKIAKKLYRLYSVITTNASS